MSNITQKKTFIVVVFNINRTTYKFFLAQNAVQCMGFLIMDYNKKYIHTQHLLIQLPNQILH